MTEEAKILYFMNNLNDSIFEKVRANFLELSTRVLFPDPYDEIKQRIIVEYGQITQRKPQTVLKVIKGEDAKRAGTFLPILQALHYGFFCRSEPQLFQQEPEEEG